MNSEDLQDTVDSDEALRPNNNNHEEWRQQQQRNKEASEQERVRAANYPKDL